MKLGTNDIIIKLGSSDVDSIYLGTQLVYSGGSEPPTPIDYENEYLTFVALENGTFKFSGNSINYSLDSGATWTSLASDTNSPTVQSGNKIMWKAELTPTTTNGVGTFSSSGRFDVESNAMSLLYGDNFSGQTSLSGKNYAFKILFSGCTKVVNAENLSLPATTLANNCYQSMFKGCTSLTTAPMLPATTLATYCYNSMFASCRSLTTAPQLPATTLEVACYASMFNGCTSLTSAPELPATTLAIQCYQGMFYNCSSLSTAPQLPATTLTQTCYRSMFSGCTSLNSITCLATDISADYCTNYWVSGVASSGTFTKAASMNSWTSGESGIPSNWTVQNYSNPTPTLQWVTFESGDDISGLDIYGVSGVAIDLQSTFSNGGDIMFVPSRTNVECTIGAFSSSCYGDIYSRNDNVELIFSNLGTCNDYYNSDATTVGGGTIQLYIYA